MITYIHYTYTFNVHSNNIWETYTRAHIFHGYEEFMNYKKTRSILFWTSLICSTTISKRNLNTILLILENMFSSFFFV